MNLIRAEWKRFFARRFIRIMLAVTVVLFAIIAIGIAADSRRATTADHMRAQEQMAADIAQQNQLISGCEQAVAAGLPDPDSGEMLPPGTTCDDFYGNSAPEERWYLPNTWTLADNGPDMIMIFGGLLALFGFATGASFIGAEWSSGGMMNLLLWRPRRIAVLSQKLAALLLCVLVSGVAFAVLWAAMIWGIVSTRGQLGSITDGMWQSFALVGVRSLVLGLAATAIGFALASIGRHTATALGIAVGYVVVVEAGGLIFTHLLDIARPERFLLSRYVAAWLSKVQHYSSGSMCSHPVPGVTTCSPGGEWVMRMGSAAEVGAILIAALLVWAYVSFARRDVS